MAVIVIEDWMIQERDLRGLELLAFALIHGCTQRGEGCWYGGYDKLAERIGGKQRGTINVVKSLEEKGAIERFDAVVEGKMKKAIRSLWYSAQNADAQNADAKNADAQNAERPLHKMQSTTAQNAEPSNTKNKKKNKYSSEVEELYAMYPTKCPLRNAETARRPFCKEIIARLLKERSFDDLKANMQRYLDENYGKHYLQNFSTFLHQFPDYSEGQGVLFREKKWKVAGERYTKEDVNRLVTDQNEFLSIPPAIRMALHDGKEVMWDGERFTIVG